MLTPFSVWDGMGKLTKSREHLHSRLLTPNWQMDWHRVGHYIHRCLEGEGERSFT